MSNFTLAFAAFLTKALSPPLVLMALEYNKGDVLYMYGIVCFRYLQLATNVNRESSNQNKKK